MQQPVKLTFGAKALQRVVKFAGYVFLFGFVILGTNLGFKLAEIFNFPDILKGLDKVTAVMLGGVLGCLVGAVFLCAAYMITESIAAPKAKTNT